MKSIKLVVTDLDGTVVNARKTISPYTQSVFERCRQHGILTCIATARYRLGAKKLRALLQPDFEISTDGAMVFQGDRLLFGTPFTLSETNQILDSLLHINAKLDITVATETDVFWNKTDRPKASILYGASYTDYVSPFSACAYKIVAELASANEAEHIARRQNCKLIAYRGENKFGFVKRDVGKTPAIRALANSLGMRMSEIAAFGDDLNDLEMLRDCGIGVAVSNALDDVKEAADVICDSNDEDGVAKWIAQNLLPAE